MKYKKIILFFVFLAVSFATANVYAQKTTIPSDVLSGFKKQQPELISKYFNSNVEIIIENKNNVYSRNQAEGIIKNFFSKNKVTDFDLIHKGDKGASGFAIGKLTTFNGSFRVHLLLRNSKNKIYIHQIRIDKLNE